MENQRNLPKSVGSKEIQNAIMGETKRVLEIMEESNEKVTKLQQDLKHSEDSLEGLENHIRMKKDSINNKKSLIECNENFKHNVNELNDKFLANAQSIYLCCEEFYKEPNLHETELDKIEGMLMKNEGEYNSRVELYETEEKKLLAVLKEMDNATIENDKKLEAAKQENKELEDKLSNLIKEIAIHQQHNKDQEQILNQEKTMYETEIEVVNEKLALVNEELDSTNQSMESTEKEIMSTKKVTEESLLDLENIIEKMQNDLANKCRQIEELTNTKMNLSNQIADKESLIKITEENIIQKGVELNVLEKKAVIIEEDHIKEQNSHEASVIETKKELMEEKERNSILSNELRTQDEKIEKLCAEIEEIKSYIDSLATESEVDLPFTLEEKQTELKEVKLKKQHLNEKLASFKIEQQQQIHKEQDEIAKIEINIKSLETSISATEDEITNKCKVEIELTTDANFKLETKISDLDKEMETTKEALRAKNAGSMHSKTFRKPSTTLRGSLQKKPRNWDSDSSLDA